MENFEREQEDAAAQEAGEIGGRAREPLTEDPPAGVDPEAWRVVEEAGGGRSEGFEEAEAELIERAEGGPGPNPIDHAERNPEDPLAREQVEGEADAWRSSATHPEDEDR